MTRLPEGFRLRNWTVTVDGYGDAEFLATSRGKALADAWRCDAFNGHSFGSFLKIARCRLSAEQPKPVPVTVNDKPMWSVGYNRAYVKVVAPGGEHVLSAHPYEVLPIEARPEAYRDRAMTTSEAI